MIVSLREERANIFTIADILQTLTPVRGYLLQTPGNTQDARPPPLRSVPGQVPVLFWSQKRSNVERGARHADDNPQALDR